MQANPILRSILNDIKMKHDIHYDDIDLTTSEGMEKYITTINTYRLEKLEENLPGYSIGSDIYPVTDMEKSFFIIDFLSEDVGSNCESMSSHIVDKVKDFNTSLYQDNLNIFEEQQVTDLAEINVNYTSEDCLDFQRFYIAADSNYTIFSMENVLSDLVTYYGSSLEIPTLQEVYPQEYFRNSIQNTHTLSVLYDIVDLFPITDPDLPLDTHLAINRVNNLLEHMEYSGVEYINSFSPATKMQVCDLFSGRNGNNLLDGVSRFLTQGLEGLSYCIQHSENESLVTCGTSRALNQLDYICTQRAVLSLLADEADYVKDVFLEMHDYYSSLGENIVF
ncbi:MAG: hypothetical protein P857_373 [Candidatus Xenolissoclinum pacificiensis L6]|uniref:Uncharacterized protein n=1 Tax=Candidatus Xenolissoclinum pacificiensis L6 TaxID=1401685 RepID=W2V1Y0_9RICK|nr:MAG: hypothetical protein P857_373 [Candidatus Xenolissoclinum pacificiensis L6]